MGHKDTGILVGPVNLRGLAVMTRIVGFVFVAKKKKQNNKPRSWKLFPYFFMLKYKNILYPV